MSGNRNSYGSISRGDSRRRRKRKDDTIRTILAVVLVCVLLLVVGFLGVNALKNNQSGDNGKETSGSNETLNNETAGTDSTPADTAGMTEEETEAATEAEDVPETVGKEHTVWIDAGHGGHDLGGAVWVKDENGNYLDWNGNIVPEASDNGAYKVREKDQALTLAMLLKSALEERGVTVLMTRTDDTHSYAKDRPPLANATNAECFVSLHRNFMLGNQNYNGIEIWGVNWEDFNSKPEKAKDQQLAEFIIGELKEEDINKISDVMRNNKTGPNGDDYSVLWRTNMPALILEMGYMSNDSDNEKFETNTEAYAEAIADGIVKWLNTQQ